MKQSRRLQLLTLLLSSAFLFWAVRRYLRAIQVRLDEAVVIGERVKDGQTDIAFPEPGNDEISLLVESFNALLGRLQEQANEKIAYERTKRRILQLALQYQAPIAHCGYLRVNRDGTEKAVAGTGELVVQNRREAMECLLLGRRFVGSLWNKLFRRDLLEGFSLREDLRINEDVLLAYQLFRRAEKSVYIDTPDYIYYVREGSACTAEQQNKKEEDLLLAAELIARDSVGTEFETAAHVRQIDILLIVYQWALFRGERVRCAELKKKLEELRPYLPALSTRQRLKRRLLTGAPRVYRWAYACYSRLRTENWDVS